ncbi:MAG: hypothetical protein LKI42_01370 [Bacteroidales bacterium]|nr:hypothetical protein [Bacteroidales bacterium]MCI1786384.1 hypothetical protein [Bacteroidales bacterium]
MKRLIIFLSIASVFSGLVSCKAISSFLKDDDAVAKVGSHKLYRSQLAAYIPDGVSSEDSTRLSLQYINSWASDQVFMEMAQQQLSKNEKDVSKELEAYKASLLKYRYEQRYINERLDTTVTDEEIETYYNKHSDKFKLEVPIVKARFLSIMDDSPNLEIIKRKMGSVKVNDLVEADSLAFSSALKYSDYSDKWIDVITLAREFGTDYVTMLSKMSNSYIDIPDNHGNEDIAYISRMMRAGEIAPLEYCTDRIRDIIISTRKHALISTLERELLNNAREKENFVIY